MDDAESNVKQAVANVLGFQPSFLRAFILFCLRRVSQEDLGGESCAVFSDDFLARVMARLDDLYSQDKEVKEIVRSAWTGQSTLPVEIFRAMAES